MTNMKKHYPNVIVATIFAMGMSCVFGQTVTITGQVTANTCNVSPAANLNVALPQLATSSLIAAGSTAGATLFQLVYTGCSPAITKVTPYFEIGTNTNSSGRLVNTASGGAQNVELQVRNEDGSVLNLAKEAGAQNVSQSTITANAGANNFIVEYYSIGNVQAGLFSTSLNYSLIYQ